MRDFVRNIVNRCPIHQRERPVLIPPGNLLAATLAGTDVGGGLVGIALRLCLLGCGPPHDAFSAVLAHEAQSAVIREINGRAAQSGGCADCVLERRQMIGRVLPCRVDRLLRGRRRDNLRYRDIVHAHLESALDGLGFGDARTLRERPGVPRLVIRVDNGGGDRFGGLEQRHIRRRGQAALAHAHDAFGHPLADAVGGEQVFAFGLQSDHLFPDLASGLNTKLTRRRAELCPRAQTSRSLGFSQRPRHETDADQREEEVSNAHVDAALDRCRPRLLDGQRVVLHPLRHCVGVCGGRSCLLQRL